MGYLKSGKFWVGVAVGAVVVPIVLSRYAPGLKAKIPGSGSQAAPQG
jgi:hypothetical protein